MLNHGAFYYFQEIILQLLRQDTAEIDPSEPKFRVLERKRRLTIANKLMESISDSVESLPSSPSPFGSLTDTLSAFDEELEKHPVRIRSRSAEGYDAGEVCTLMDQIGLNRFKIF